MIKETELYWKIQRMHHHREVMDYWKAKDKFYDNSTRLYWELRFRKEQPEAFSYWQTELRTSGGTIYGKVPYDSLSNDIGGFYEKLKYGCFSDSLNSDKDIFFLLSHDTAKPIASTKSGSLKLTDTPSGLEFELKPGSTQAGRDTLQSVKEGVTRGVSFGFVPKDEEWLNNQIDLPIRIIKNAKLMELSACIFPAYEGTKIWARGRRV
jgi:HK97 family phage prohead protease